MRQEIMGFGNTDQAGTTAANHSLLNKGSRAEFMAFANSNEVPEHIKEGLRNGKLKLADFTLYGIRQVDSKTIKMFSAQDQKKEGFRNLHQGRLPKGTCLLASGVQVLSAWTVAATPAEADEEENAMYAKFVPIDTTYPEMALIGVDSAGNVATVIEGEAANALATITAAISIPDAWAPFGALETGWMTLKANRSELISEMPLTVFKQNNNALYAPGFHKLDNPRLIADDVEIELDIELGRDVEGDNPDDGEAVWVLVALYGTATIPA